MCPLQGQGLFSLHKQRFSPDRAEPSYVTAPSIGLLGQKKRWQWMAQALIGLITGALYTSYALA
jgi:hypothetical protein